MGQDSGTEPRGGGSEAGARAAAEQSASAPASVEAHAPEARPRGRLRRARGWTRFWPLLLLLLGGGLAYFLGLGRYASLGALAEYREALLLLVATRPFEAVLLYLLVYAAATSFFLPGMPLTLAGGFLFGPWAGIPLAVCGATLGGCVLFLVTRSVFGPMVLKRAGNLVERLRPELERDGFWYLMSLRFLPVVPFWLGNVAAALVGMRLAVFAGATALGILPGTAVFAWIGAGLGEVFDRGGALDLSVVLSPLVGLPFLVLAGLALVTTWWRRRNAEEQDPEPRA
ncbi:TVP38/TMEM64 family protein [Roseomonas elaeocarpi]|uniref:TVP38/TMEM64 family membrane protein n=1 Tax=Roseomonas elaeocarpi TaxID=907779 RepID=A0ABV6JZB0_9PROT